jgi:SAM-dependent methyltransferase
MAKNNEFEYQEKIKKEANFWDERAEVLMSSGRIPLWFDQRRGEDVSFIPINQLRGAGLRANPILYRIVFEDMMNLIIKESTERIGNVLDLGCGAGWFSLELARCGMRVDGYDIGPKQIEIARKFSQESRESADPFLHGNFGSTDYKVVDLNKVCLEEEKYEAVISLGTLHHIQHLNHLLNEIYKSLKPQGKFIFYEYTGYYGLSRIFPFIFKILELLKRLIRIQVCNQSSRRMKTSPFEGISKREIIERVNEKFVIKRIESKFLFLPAIVSGLRIYRLPNSIGALLVKIFYSVDKTLIKLKLFKGSFVFVIAHKNSNNHK